MRIVFMGTPDFAVPSLERLIQAGHTVCGVFCQPDKPVGRHQNKLQAPPVKQAALEHGIPVFQPTKLRDGTALAQLKELDPELIVVAAYGRILPQEILDYPKFGCINVHSSLLPKYRGAAPINWAVINGETETGVTIMYMATELDAGDIIAQASTPIDPDETVETLHDRLAQMGGEDGGRPGRRHRRTDPPGRVEGHLCTPAVPGPVPHRLDQAGQGHPRPGAGPDALARHLHGHSERGDGEGVRRPGDGGEHPEGPRHRSGRRKRGHRRLLRRWQGDPHYRTSGAGVPADGGGGLFAGAPDFCLI